MVLGKCKILLKHPENNKIENTDHFEFNFDLKYPSRKI
jgi:hypothetical protein